MHLRDFDLLTGKEINPPEIIWEKDDRYAIIAFLLLSVDGSMSDENKKKFDAFMDADRVDVKNSIDGEDNNHAALTAAKDAIIRESNAFFDSLDRDESYCDYVLDEIDCIIDGKEKCGIGGGYMTWGRSGIHKDLPGGAYMLFDYIKLQDFDNGYSKNQKRIIKRLAQKWDVDKSVLTAIEDHAKTLYKIFKKRHETENSDMPHREAVSALSALEAEEKAVWKKLNDLNIAKNRAASAYVTNMNTIADVIDSLGGESTRLRLRYEDEPESNEEEKEESLSDKIGDCIVDGIYKVGDLLCAPFEWMTDKLMGM